MQAHELGGVFHYGGTIVHEICLTGKEIQEGTLVVNVLCPLTKDDSLCLNADNWLFERFFSPEFRASSKN